MTTVNWFTVAQITSLLAVCGFAVWAARLIAEAANNSAIAAEQAVTTAKNAERTAADMREMREALRVWLDEQQTRVDLYDEQRTPRGPVPTGRVATDTAEAHAVLTPQAIIDRDNIDSIHDPRNSSAPHRGRHARSTDPVWTAALRAATTRMNRDK